MKILLASSSPYRRQLLARLGLPFEHASPDIDETRLTEESPQALVARLSEAKAKALAPAYEQHLIIGSDQVAAFKHTILGKPLNHTNAVQQLEQFSGKHVDFYTGLCLLNSHTGRAQVSVERCRVKFRPLSPAQIEHYLQSEKPYDCAGSFKSEGRGIALFESIETPDPNILIGLPLIKLTDMLINEGVDPLTY